MPTLTTNRHTKPKVLSTLREFLTKADACPGQRNAVLSLATRHGLTVRGVVEYLAKQANDEKTPTRQRSIAKYRLLWFFGHKARYHNGSNKIDDAANRLYNKLVLPIRLARTRAVDAAPQPQKDAKFWEYEARIQAATVEYDKQRLKLYMPVIRRAASAMDREALTKTKKARK